MYYQNCIGYTWNIVLLSSRNFSVEEAQNFKCKQSIEDRNQTKNFSVITFRTTAAIPFCIWPAPIPFSSRSVIRLPDATHWQLSKWVNNNCCYWLLSIFEIWMDFKFPAKSESIIINYHIIHTFIHFIHFSNSKSKL